MLLLHWHNFSGVTPLHKADIFNELDVQDRDNNTPYRAVVVARLLLRHTTDVTAKNCRGDTAFCFAADRGIVGMVKLLVMHVAKARHQDEWLRKPLDIAIR